MLFVCCLFVYLFSVNRWSIWKKLKIVVCFVYSFIVSRICKNLFLWFRFDLTRLIIVFFLLFLKLNRSINTKKKNTMMTIQSYWFTVQLLEKKKQFIKQYNFEKMYWSRCSCSNNIVSKKTYYTNTTIKSHNIVSKKRIMQSYYISILQNRNSINKKTKIRSRKTNNVENIWFFRILIDLIFWQILIKSKKFDFAFFASM